MRLPLLAVAALLVAGCATPDGDDVDPAAANATTAEGAPPPAADARVDDGTRTDLGHMPHMHDYWKSRERVTLFDDEVDPSEPNPVAVAATLWLQQQVKAGSLFWLLPDGAIVYEGTGQLEVTATWTDPLVTSMGMYYRTPESREWTPTLTPLPNGKATVLDVTPAMTDMPHAKTSRWAFAFEPSESPGLAMAPFHLKVDIVKMRDVGLFPAHPQLFEGQPTKVLHDTDHSFSEVSYPKRAPGFLTSGEFGEKIVTLERLVPMETLWMQVEVDVLDATASPGQVADIRFFYHGADRSVIGHPYVIPVEGSLAQKRLVYAFPVTMEETDTPYGNESQWRFFVEPTSTFTGQEGEPDCGGCTDVSISYHMRVTAYDHVPEGAVASKMEGDE